VSRWPLYVILALAPLWLVGVLHRGLWTPDEPREADIAWRMSQQSDQTLPQLANDPFLEKPPLTYWISAASLRAFGDSPAAARLPNIVYATAAALAIGALAYAISGAEAAFFAALIAGTALIAFRVTIWLAPDACLLGACATALLGAYLGFAASPGVRKLGGYTLMHAGAAVGFMAKSAPGWLVPALALMSLIAWERRWAELRRWELYAGLILQSLIIGPWLFAVAHTSHGADALLALFWHNVVGRFTKVAGPAALDYTSGHRNSFGKYLIELPVYLLPWTLLAAAALTRAWRRVRAPNDAARPWRFALAASVPLLALLSVAATARDIYAAPAILGLSLTTALWASELSPKDTPSRPSRLDRLAVWGTLALIGLIALVLVVILAVLAAAAAPGAGRAYSLAALLVLASAFVSLRRAAGAHARGDFRRGFVWAHIAYATSFTLSAVAIFPAVDRWQDLPALARRIDADSRGPLALLEPDETTIAMLDHPLRRSFDTLKTDSNTRARTVSDWFRGRGTTARVLVKLPGSGSGELSRLLSSAADKDDGVAAALATEGIATIVNRYELPQGRRYALLAPSTTVGDSQVVARCTSQTSARTAIAEDPSCTTARR